MWKNSVLILNLRFSLNSTRIITGVEGDDRIVLAFFQNESDFFVPKTTS